MRKTAKYHDYEQSDESFDEPSYSPASSKKKKEQPRFIKNQIQDIDTNVIVLNVSRTQYPIIQQIAVEMGWQIDTQRKSQVWDLMWIDTHIEAHDLFKLNQHQKISHYPSIQVLTRKNLLAKSLMRMSKLFPEQYNFFPFTWNLPSQFTELARYQSKRQETQQQNQFYIYKPESQAQGKGIKIFDNLEVVDNRSGIVQLYINNPYLIENLKFDLRIYVLIMGINPIRIFIYDEGLGRFATQKYEKVSNRNIKDSCMHLTNYAINRKNKNFIFNTSEKAMDKGHKRSLSAIYTYLRKKGVNIEKVKEQIDKVIVKTLLVGEPMLKHTYNLSRSNENLDDVCFQILGLDILINEKLEPILLEVNHTPSFKADTPLDKFIKKNLIKDTIKLLNLNVERKKQIIEAKKNQKELRIQRKRVEVSQLQKNIQKQQKIKSRDQYEQNNCGNFRKIYPTQNEEFQKFRDESTRIFNEQNGLKNRVNKRDININRPKSLCKVQKKQQKESPKIISREGLSSSSPLKNIADKKARYMDKINLFQFEELRDKFPTLNYLKKNEKDSNDMCIFGSQSTVMKNHRRPGQNIASINRQFSESVLQNLKISEKGSYVAPTVLGLDNLSDAGRNGKSFQKYRGSPSPAFVRKSQKKLPNANDREKPQQRISEEKLSNYKKLFGNLLVQKNERHISIARNSDIVKSKYIYEDIWKLKH